MPKKRKYGIRQYTKSDKLLNKSSRFALDDKTGDDTHYMGLQPSIDSGGEQEEVEVAPKAVGQKRQRLLLFLKENVALVVEILLGAIIIPYIVWSVTSTFDLQKDVALIEVELEHLEFRLEQSIAALGSLEADTVTKDYLMSQLEIVRLQLQSASDKDIDAIELEIKLIENKIVSLENAAEKKQ